MATPPQMMRSVHIEQNTRVLHLSCALPLLLTPTGPAAWHTPCDSRDRRGQAGLSVASSYDTTDTVSQLELSSEPSCWPACWCKPQRPERHHLVFLGSIMLCRTLRMLWWFCRFPWEFSDSSHLGSPQYLPLSPLLDRPGVRHFRHPTHRALCSQFTLIFRIGLAFPPKLTTLSQAQDPFHASLARCFVFFLSPPFPRSGPGRPNPAHVLDPPFQILVDSLPTMADTGFIVDGLFINPGSRKGDDSAALGARATALWPLAFLPKTKTQAT